MGFRFVGDKWPGLGGLPSGQFRHRTVQTDIARVMMTNTVTGGCQCGRIRYAVVIDSDEAYLCHCRIRTDLTWTTREPDRYASSPIANRGFCSACGTPLTFEFADGEAPGLDLTVGSFDDPYRFRPTSHFAIESWHSNWPNTRDLPGKRSEDNPSTRDRWMKVVGKLPD
jgi:hypothetical protein